MARHHVKVELLQSFDYRSLEKCSWGSLAYARVQLLVQLPGRTKLSRSLVPFSEEEGTVTVVPVAQFVEQVFSLPAESSVQRSGLSIPVSHKVFKIEHTAELYHHINCRDLWWELFLPQ